MGGGDVGIERGAGPVAEPQVGASPWDAAGASQIKGGQDLLGFKVPVLRSGEQSSPEVEELGGKVCTWVTWYSHQSEELGWDLEVANGCQPEQGEK